MTSTVIVDVFDDRYGTACSRLLLAEDGDVQEVKTLWDDFFSFRKEGIDYAPGEFSISIKQGRELFDAVLPIHKSHLAGLNDFDVICCTSESLGNLKSVLRRSSSLAVVSLRWMSWAEAVQ